MQSLQRLCNRTCQTQHAGQTGFRLAVARDNLRACSRAYDSSWAVGHAARLWPGAKLLRPVAATAHQDAANPSPAEQSASEIHSSGTHGTGHGSSSSSSSSSIQGQSAAGISPGTWADGDVLRLTLADGRTVYAEAVRASAAVNKNQKQTPSSGSRRQQQQQQQQPGRASVRKGSSAPAAPAATQTATGANGSGSSGPLVLVCQGCRYQLVEKVTSCGGAAAVGTAGPEAVREACAGGAGSGGGHGDASGGGGSRWTLQLLGAALPPSDPLLTSPPGGKAQVQLLRTWAAVRPPAMHTSPASSPSISPAPQAGADASQPSSSQSQPDVTAGVAAGAAGADTGGGDMGMGGGGPLHGAEVAAAAVVASLAGLRAMAAERPGVWCDGAGPSDPWPPAPDDLALYTAAELLCLMEGRRGVALLQLHVGWERHAATPPYGPYKPLVLRLLREALGRTDIVPYVSVVPGGGGAAGAGGSVGGLTVVLAADKEPFRSWGAHLASFGCQAALEAQSAYYKLLVGRVLGYAPANIAHHIQSKHGAPPSPEVVAAVEAELRRQSAKQPTLPWNVSSRGSRKKGA